MRAIWLVLFVLFGTQAHADYNASKAWFNGLKFEDRQLIQYVLIFASDYNALVDGEFGRRTYRAIVGFQANNRFVPDGILSRSEYEAAVAAAESAMESVGFQILIDPATDIELGVPTLLTPNRITTDRGTAWNDSEGSVDLQTIVIRDEEESFDDLFRRLSANQPDHFVEYAVNKGSYFIVSGIFERRSFYTRMQRAPRQSKGFYLSWSSDNDAGFSQLAAAISNTLNTEPVGLPPTVAGNDPRAGAGTPRRAPPHASAADGSERQQTTSSGTGYIVSGKGHIATNAHVVENCPVVDVSNRGRATVVKADPVNDVAILQLESRTAEFYATFRPLPVKRGEEVYAVGYPLASLLGNNLTISDGIVSSLAGLGGEVSNFLITAPVQPGNSGGPVIDRHGHVIGTVTARLSESKTLEVAGALPQNVNFAVRSGLTVALLMSVNQSPTFGDTDLPLPPDKIAELSETYTVQIVCRPAAQ